jgi:hypothetical protein
LPRVTNAKPATSASTAPLPYCPSRREPRAFLRKVMSRQIPTNGHKSFAQFFPIASVPTIAETAEPLITVHLSNRCPRSDDFPTLAAPVARSTDLIQSAKRGRQAVGLGKRALAGGLSCPIKIKDGPGAPCSIHQFSRLLVGGEWPSEQIIEQERAQRFDWSLRKLR